MGDVVVLSAKSAFRGDCLLGCSGASWTDFPSGEVTSSVLDPICVRNVGPFPEGDGGAKGCVEDATEGASIGFLSCLVPNGIMDIDLVDSTAGSVRLIWKRRK